MTYIRVSIKLSDIEENIITKKLHKRDQRVKSIFIMILYTNIQITRFFFAIIIITTDDGCNS